MTTGERRGDVLVVDDEPRLRRSIELLVGSRGHDVCGVGSAMDALAALAARRFDVVLLDLNLPDRPGITVMDEIVGGRDAPTVIVISGDDSIDGAIAALRRGAYDFLRKPFVPEQLLHTLDNALHRRRLERANRDVCASLSRSERIHRCLVETSPDVILLLDESGRVAFANDRTHTLLDWPRGEIVGRRFHDLLHPDDVAHVADVEASITAGECSDGCSAEARLAARDEAGTYRDFQLTLVPLHGEELDGVDAAPSVYVVARDIAARKRTEALLAFHAYHDALTGVPNRTLFKDRLGIAMAQARRCDARIAVMYLDLDGFKLINDGLGHAVGDRLLQHVAKRLQGCLRRSDTLARIGGDEFVVLLFPVARAEDAAAVAQKLLAEIARPFHIDGREIGVGVSIGITMFPDDAADIETLMGHADVAMYHAKWGGKNTWRFFAGAMSDAFRGRLALESELRTAIDRGEFVLYYQPQIDAPTRRIVGFEALVRWQHPSARLVMPDEFIPLAEETRLIEAVTDRVLDLACAQVSRWRAAGHADVAVSVNVSPYELRRPGIVERIARVLREHRVPRGALAVEITESGIVGDGNGDTGIAMLEALGRLGVRISIDDFGTRYSSLNYLRRLPVHALKVDRSFVRDLSAPELDARLVGAILAIASGFGLGVVAEGIETPAQAAALRHLGCRRMQGFLFSPPVPADAATRLLDDPAQMHDASGGAADEAPGDAAASAGVERLRHVAGGTP